MASRRDSKTDLWYVDSASEESASLFGALSYMPYPNVQDDRFFCKHVTASIGNRRKQILRNLSQASELPVLVHVVSNVLSQDYKPYSILDHSDNSTGTTFNLATVKIRRLRIDGIDTNL